MQPQRELSDAEKVVKDRRAFLRGFMLTSAGILVPRRTISIPHPIIQTSYTISLNLLDMYRAGAWSIVGDNGTTFYLTT